MEILDKAYKTVDNRIFEDKQEAIEHEKNLSFEKDFVKLLSSWMGYCGMDDDLKPIAKRAAADKDKVRKLFEV